MKKIIILMFIVDCFIFSVPSSFAGDSEWATAGKVLAGVVGASVVGNMVSNDYYYHRRPYYTTHYTGYYRPHYRTYSTTYYRPNYYRPGYRYANYRYRNPGYVCRNNNVVVEEYYF